MNELDLAEIAVWLFYYVIALALFAGMVRYWEEKR